MRFAPLPQTVEEERTTFFGFTTADIRRLVEVIALAFVGILVILLFVRPLVLKIFEVTPQAIARAREGATGDQQLLANAGMAQIEAPVDENGMPIPQDATSTVGTAQGGMPVAQAPGSPINIENIEGRVKESSLKKVGEIIDKHPEEAVAIIRNWMYQDQA